jgi:Lipase (class 3)
MYFLFAGVEMISVTLLKLCCVLVCAGVARSANSGPDTTTMFPTSDDALEMASLSYLVYAFHREDYGNNDVDNNVCERINNSTNDGNRNDYNIDRPIPSNIRCEWYHHDWTGGTQVMIVSSIVKSYVAVVFAGTDDLRTSLTDANILMASFGTSDTTLTSSGTKVTDESDISSTTALIRDRPMTEYPIYNVTLPDAPLARVHAGFDHAIFDRNLFGEIVTRVEAIRCQSGKLVRCNGNSDNEHCRSSTYTRLFTTGHSLGAANSVLTAVGLVRYYEQVRSGHILPSSCDVKSPQTLEPVDHLVSINFGCPQTGNAAWRDYIHSNPTMLRRLTIWRFVLGWDLVPRLPEVFNHVGHTVQCSNFHSLFANQSMLAYYQHLGNASLKLAGVPFGWSAKPFLWMPGALYSHFMARYWTYLTEWSQIHNASRSDGNETSDWIHSFERVPDVPPPDDDERPPNVDDDFYVDPPNERRDDQQTVQVAR